MFLQNSTWNSFVTGKITEVICVNSGGICGSSNGRSQFTCRQMKSKIEVGYYDESEKIFALIRNITINIGCSCVHK